MTSLVLPLHGHSGIGRVDIRRRFPSAALDLLPPLRRPATPTRPAAAIAFLASARRPPAPAPAEDADWYASPKRWHTRFAP